MTAIGIIRCEKNETACPLASCLACLRGNREAFARYGEPGVLVGVLTCRAPGDQCVALARILKNKGAEVIHFPTCLAAHKQDGAWVQGQGLCDRAEEMLHRVAKEVSIPCVLGSAHLPPGTEPRVFT